MVWTNSASSVLEAATLIIQTGTTNSGIFVYDGVPTFGNLVGTWTSQSGTDPYGNAYKSGISAFGGALTSTTLSNSTIGSPTILTPSIQRGTMTDTLYSLNTTTGAILVYATSTATTTFTSGSGTFTVPAGVTSLNVQCWGGGGGGGAPSGFGGGGGGGGEFAQEPTLTVTPGESLTYTVGAGSTTSANGGDTFFQRSGTDLVRAHGGVTSNTGNGAVGGSGSANSVHFNGGNGGNGYNDGSGNGSGGGAGSSAGTGAAGANGVTPTGYTGGAGGIAPTGGGNGGAGGSALGGGTCSNGVTGSGPGGGGGGAPTGPCGSGDGANGQVTISYTSAQALIGSWAGVAGTDQYGNSYPQGFYVNPVYAGAYSPGTTSVETWHAPTYATGFAGGPFSGSVIALGYRLNVDGTVQLSGAFHTTTAQSANATAFTIPASWVPATANRLPCVINTGGTLYTDYLEVDPSGAVLTGASIQTGSDVYVSSYYRLS